VTSNAAETRARALLLAGVVAGATLAGVSLVGSGSAPAGVPEGVVAVVNGVEIPEESYRRIEAAVLAERRGRPLEEEQRRRLLDRLVDEELLLQRGLDLGLARHEPTARRAIVAALIATVAADAETEEPAEETLRRFHSDEAERFQRPGRVEVDALFVSVAVRPEAEAYRRAAEAAERLRAGEEPGEVERALADPQTTPLPGGKIPLETVREYLGPSAAQALVGLAPGGVSVPVRGAAGYGVLRLLDRDGGETAPFEEIRDQVRTEWLRVRGEKALTHYLDQLRDAGTVEVRLPPVPKPDEPPATPGTP
jgi:hypothetical protein